MKFLLNLIACVSVSALISACGGQIDNPTKFPVLSTNSQAGDEGLAELGKIIFNDINLSEPRGTACANCHQNKLGFAGNNGGNNGVAIGSLSTSVGSRNAMTNSYLGLIPSRLSFVTANKETEAIGGFFWDGRAETPELQALGPLLNPLEMNNQNSQSVVEKIARSSYSNLFQQVFGSQIFSDTDKAFSAIGVAIAAFELSRLQPYNSKYDAMVRKELSFNQTETIGMNLFMDPLKGNCAACHLMNPTSGNPKDSPFSEFTYYASGIPRNTAIPKNTDPTFYDLGLCGPDRALPTLPLDVAPNITIENFCGKFRMPSLRNVAERPAYMHNGIFKDLETVVRFYSTRNSNPHFWYGQSVSNDLPLKYLKNIEVAKAPFNRPSVAGAALSEDEIYAIVAFLKTLSDR